MDIAEEEVAVLALAPMMLHILYEVDQEDLAEVAEAEALMRPV